MRLNTITIEYLKELPVEHFSDTLYDIVVNEVNGNYEKEEDVLEGLEDILRINFLVYQFMLEINNGGFHNFFNSSYAKYYCDMIEALGAINAEETMDALADAVQLVKKRLHVNEEELKAALDSGTLYEIDEDQELIIELKDLDERLKLSDEPVADYLVEMIKKEVKGRDDDEVI